MWDRAFKSDKYHIVLKWLGELKNCLHCCVKERINFQPATTFWGTLISLTTAEQSLCVCIGSATPLYADNCLQSLKTVRPFVCRIVCGRALRSPWTVEHWYTARRAVRWPSGHYTDHALIIACSWPVYCDHCNTVSVVLHAARLQQIHHRR